MKIFLNDNDRKEYNREKTLRYRKRHPYKIEMYYKNKRQKVISILGGKCIKCGFDDFRALQIDHINGQGGKEFDTIGSIAIYNKIIDNGSNGKYQLLCANCNFIKQYERREYGKHVTVT